MPIYFYSTRDNYGCFSNFSAHGITLQGKWWPTSEHYFQAQKFAGTEHEEHVRLAKTPKQAAEMGRQRSRPLRAEWEQIKDDVMREAVLEKFRTHLDIQRSCFRLAMKHWSKPRAMITIGAAARTELAKICWA